MIDLLTHDGLRPFLWAVGLVLGLLVLEIVLHLLGMSSEIGGEAEAGLEADAGPDAGAGPGGWGLEAPPGADAQDGDGAPGGVLDALGLRGVPLTIWFALLAATFAGAGLALQMALHAATDGLLGPRIATLLALPPAVLLTSRLSRLLALALPRETTAAISERSFGRRFGDVTVGVARAGHPAQVRFTDQFGNLQYLMAEPLDPGDEFREGARVLILRAADGTFRIAGAQQ